ncbi:hypothetical protein A3D78_05025 [Candidatus Gottesmanbacteria bacterium RIFCSPHIGHO2_02_FULL_39_14]|uniref:Membrane protein 6-pyruvoyl-tetrahydropterin synthase-related domain-containing protein n=1 Tax=Candidatus Gottesmanbacteria bacterium RIFCSPHIGHO2_02_FULL_39_14 TaxID=1798383 RepID=A0A1F5ZZX5_9BACT|nr:MAG: hypothetical protein A3D78_05025 [Candidatus Gottesmanbacteria bacterium RIFCSPHIGHO2_02_FULL_39_14]
MKLPVRYLYLLLGLVILIPVLLPLFSPYIYGTADGLAHRFRLVSFVNSLKQGYLRPRWLSDQALGFGSPITLFIYILPYYVTAGIKLTGLDMRTTTQIYQGITIILSFIFMYKFAAKLWGKRAGLAAATVYSYAPYRLLTIYLYEGWGEMTAFVYPPLILYLATKLNEKSLRITFLFLTVVWFLFILTHNVSILMYIPILLIIGVMLLKKRIETILFFICSLLTGIVLSAFFTLPALTLNHLTAYPTLIAKEAGMRGTYYKPILFQIETAVETIRKGKVDYYDFTIGLAYLLVIIAFPLLFRQFKNGKIKFALLIFFLFIFCLYLTMPSSDWIWRNLTFMKYIVYPFRFLHPATFLGALLVAIITMKSRKLAIFFIISAIISGFSYTRPEIEIFPFNDDYFSQFQTLLSAPGTLKNMATVEFLPKTANINYLMEVENKYLTTKIKPVKFEFSSPVEVIRDKIKAEEMEVEYRSDKDAILTVNSFYFPNWQAAIDEREDNLAMDGNGRMKLEVPSGKHKVIFKFGFSKIERLANMVSLLGIFILAGEVLWMRGKRK